jgi:hypothetical protein
MPSKSDEGKLGVGQTCKTSVKEKPRDTWDEEEL